MRLSKNETILLEEASANHRGYVYDILPNSCPESRVLAANKLVKRGFLARKPGGVGEITLAGRMALKRSEEAFAAIKFAQDYAAKTPFDVEEIMSATRMLEEHAKAIVAGRKLVCDSCHRLYWGTCEGHEFYGANCCDDHFCSRECRRSAIGEDCDQAMGETGGPLDEFL